MRNQFTPDRMALIKKSKTTNLKDTHTPIFIAALFMTAKTWKKLRSSNMTVFTICGIYYNGILFTLKITQMIIL